MARFKGKGPNKTASGSDEGNQYADQTQNKRDASKRKSVLAKAPEHIRAKWEATCALRGRDRDKNAQKSKFTEVLLRDAKFQDVYWQTEVTDKYSRKHTDREQWVIRAVANTRCGGGKDGAAAVQDAVDAGVWLSRVTKKKGRGRADEGG